MNKIRNLLITGTGSGGVGEALVKVYMRSKIRNKLRLITANINYYAPAMFSGDKYFLLPLATDEKYNNEIKSLIDLNDISYIIPGSEEELWFFHKNRDEFSNRTNLLINTDYCINNCFSKKKSYSFLRNNGYIFPKIFKLPEVDFSNSKKIILKPDKGHGSKGIYFINDKEELKLYVNLLRYKKVWEDYIISEYIYGLEYTAGIIGDYRRENFEIIIFNRILRHGASWVVKIFNDKRIESILKEIVFKLKSIGSLNIQFKIKENLPIILEINPRFSGSSVFRSHYGFNEIDMFIDLLEGNDLSWKMINKDDTGIRYYKDYYINEESCK